MNRSLFSGIFSLFLFSCSVLEEKVIFEYPGDRFSRSLATAKCMKQGSGLYRYDMGRNGEILLDVSSKNASIIDGRKGNTEKESLGNFHYYGKVDPSLRYFIRETMTVQELKRLLGAEHEKWGGVASPMLVWPMVDERYLAILPSALEMPEGMNSYNVLDKYKRLYRNVRLLKLGEAAQ
ncbi:MAG: hypothetical protein MK132_13345 [Lentisphaerales bacterium]|nr:hypothetical protein [Lentisphaerales bacterium]